MALMAPHEPRARRPDRHGGQHGAGGRLARRASAGVPCTDRRARHGAAGEAGRDRASRRPGRAWRRSSDWWRTFGERVSTGARACFVHAFEDPGVMAGTARSASSSSRTFPTSTPSSSPGWRRPGLRDRLRRQAAAPGDAASAAEPETAAAPCAALARRAALGGGRRTRPASWMTGREPRKAILAGMWRTLRSSLDGAPVATLDEVGRRDPPACRARRVIAEGAGAPELPRSRFRAAPAAARSPASSPAGTSTRPCSPHPGRRDALGASAKRSCVRRGTLLVPMMRTWVESVAPGGVAGGAASSGGDTGGGGTKKGKGPRTKRGKP